MPALPAHVLARPKLSSVWVVVPAHNEEDLVGASIDSILAAADQVDVPVEITVVLDGCTDRTARRIPAGVRTLAVDHRSAGAARRTGLRDAGTEPGAWYATTDADSVVPPHWLTDLTRSAADHDLRAGTIRVENWAGRDDRVRRWHDADYRDRPGHGHVHGANLAVSAAAYRCVGGFRPLVVHEDVDLVTRCREAGFVVDWSATAPVITSARRRNRVGGGFGGLLNRVEEGLNS